MDKLNDLILFVLPGSTASIAAAPDAIPGDPWPGVENDDARMQAALDTLVTWTDGVTPPTGAQVRARIPAWQAFVPPPGPPTPRESARADMSVATDIAGMKTAMLAWMDAP